MLLLYIITISIINIGTIIYYYN